MAGGPAAADTGGAKLQVSATVLKRASLKVLAQPSSVLVTPLDITRGYVEVPDALRVTVQSNNPAGYMLIFSGSGDFVRHARIKGLDSEVQLSSNGGIVPQRGAAQGVLKRTVQLSFRFALADTARLGEHEWPLQVSVAPL